MHSSTKINSHSNIHKYIVDSMYIVCSYIVSVYTCSINSFKKGFITVTFAVSLYCGTHKKNEKKIINKYSKTVTNYYLILYLK